MQKENSLWFQMWESNDINFHDENINPFLLKYFDKLNLPIGSTVLVPLCGKSKDLFWLASQGYNVIGVELSPIACHDLFSEFNLIPTISQKELFTIYAHEKIKIFCGDLFALKKPICQK